MAEKTTAYSYLRISSDQQRVGDGIRRQMEASKLYAERHGYNLVETMSDVGISAFKGKNVREGALGIFLQAINEGKIKTGSVLLVESLDRLSRDKVLSAFSQFTSILEKGVGIVTLADGQHYTSESVTNNVGQLFTSIGMMVQANNESVLKSVRIKAAWARKRELVGEKPMTGNSPAWMTLNDDRKGFTLDEQSADIVRQIFNMSIKGMGAYSIAKQLNGNIEKYPPISRSKRWNPSYVKNILENSAAWGSFQPRQKIDGVNVAVGEPMDDYYPAVIDKDTFNLAQSRSVDRSSGGAGKKGEYFSNLFSGLLKCGSCGAPLYMRQKGAHGKIYKFVRCSKSLYNDGCNAPAWRSEQLEQAFMKFASEVKFSDLLGDVKDDRVNLEGARATSIDKLKKLDASYEALVAQFENPDIPDMLMQKLIARSVDLEASITNEKAALNDLEINIIRQSHEGIDTEQKDFLVAYAAIKDSEDKEQLREIRFSMNSLLKRNIDTITIYNEFTINPWEVNDLISPSLHKSMGEKTDEELESYFSKPHGQRLYAESERYFAVKFKSGAVRVVQPFENKTFMSISERLATMRNQDR